jgi:hypothetical protein
MEVEARDVVVKAGQIVERARTRSQDKSNRQTEQNALRHSPPGGAVVVLLEAPAPGGSQVRVAIRDPGPGFVAADLPHAFEPFFTRRKGGTGLGLSIVQQIVEQHGGRVEARNDPAGGAEVVPSCRSHPSWAGSSGHVRPFSNKDPPKPRMGAARRYDRDGGASAGWQRCSKLE